MTKKHQLSLLERIRELLPNLSEQQKNVAAFVLENHKKVAFMTTTELSLAAGSSNTTINRFCISLGFKGYASFQDELKALVQSELTAIERMDEIVSEDGENSLQLVFSNEIEALTKTLGRIPRTDYGRALDILSSSGRTVIVGHQACEPVAEYAAYALGKIKSKVSRLTLMDLDVIGLLGSLNEKDAALVFCMPRYPTQTVNLLEELKKRNVRIVLISHSEVCPYRDCADVFLSIPIAYHRFTDGLSPLICFINAIALDLYRRSENDSKQNLKNFENIAHYLFE
jgi:DNA-binding MurR/RpiR family transcriptional regulator